MGAELATSFPPAARRAHLELAGHAFELAWLALEAAERGAPPQSLTSPAIQILDQVRRSYARRAAQEGEPPR